MINPPAPLPTRYDPPLRTARRVESPAHVLFRWYAMVVSILLAAYLFFDRGVAYIHIPGTPLYIGELTLTLGIAGIIVGTNWVRPAIQGDVLLTLVVIFMGWGLFRAVANVGKYSFIDIVHDYALCYYGMFAILTVITASGIPDFPGRLVRGFSRILPFLIPWSLIALGMSKFGFKGPHVFGAAIFSHKAGNVCVVTCLALVFLWVMPDERRTPQSKVILTIIGLTTVAFAVTQTRGGSAAALLGLVVGLVFMGAHRRARVIIPVIAGLVLVVAVAGSTDLTIHTKKRTISLQDVIGLAETGLGAATGSTNPALYGARIGAGTARFRDTLWKNILHDQIKTGHLITGLGFGPNLASIGGAHQGIKNANAATSVLRSAHNSHLDVEARTGLIGLALWLTIFAVWFLRMLSTRRRFKERGDLLHRGLCEALMAMMVALLVNAFFDPTLEGAQVAAVAWTAVGLGVLLWRGPIMPGPTVWAKGPSPVPVTAPV